MAIQTTDLADIESFLSLYQLEKDDVCLVGSAVLAHIGIRPNNDIDLILRSSLRRSMFKTNNTIRVSDHIEIVQSPWSSIFTDDNIIDNNKLHNKLDNGYKVVVPELLYHKKCWLNREKDQDDIKELIQYAEISQDWDTDLIKDYLPQKNLFTTILYSIINRVKSFKKWLSVKSTIFHKDVLEIIPTNILLSKQYRNNVFNRFDLIVRYMVIESVFKKDENTFGLYNCMQNKRGNSPYISPLSNFKELIKSVKDNGFDMQSPVVVNEQLHIIDGAHRVACALYLRISELPIRVIRDRTRSYYGLEWFQQNSFKSKELQLLQDMKEKIFFNNYMYFEVLLWPPVADFFDKIEQDISSVFKIIYSRTYNNFSDFNSYVQAIYSIDDIQDWKVQMKIEGMETYPSNFRRIMIYIDEPGFRYKEINNQPISSKVEDLKKQIREKYAREVPNYFHDIIIHIGDNYEHTRRSHKISKEFNLE